MKRVYLIIVVLALVCAMTPFATAEQCVQALGKDELSLVPVNLTFAVDQAVLDVAVGHYEARIGLLGYDGRGYPNARADCACLINRLSGEELYKNIRIISASPNGGRFLICVGDTLAIWDEPDGAIRFLFPTAGLTAEDVYLLLSQQLRTIEDTGITWSSDGRYIALSFIREVLMKMRLNYGTLLINAETGEVKPMIEYSKNFSLIDFMEKYPGTPIRAAFDPDNKSLYYEVYNREGNAINRYGLETGETEKLLAFEMWLTSTDPSLWWTEEGLMTVFTSNNFNEGFGVSIRKPGGMATLVYGDADTSLGMTMYGSHLISMEGRHGILFAFNVRETKELQILPRSMVLFSLDGLTGDVFQKTLFIRPGAPPDQRLEIIFIPPDAAREDTRPLRDDLDAGRLVQPINGALSPDGKYAMFAIQNANTGAALYVYDIKNNMCGRVNLGALGINSNVFAFYACPMNQMHRGIRWLGDNRILLDINGEYRLYELQDNSYE